MECFESTLKCKSLDVSLSNNTHTQTHQLPGSCEGSCSSTDVNAGQSFNKPLLQSHRLSTRYTTCWCSCKCKTDRACLNVHVMETTNKNRLASSHLRLLVELQYCFQSSECLLFLCLFLCHFILSIRGSRSSVDESEGNDCKNIQANIHFLFVCLFVASSNGDLPCEEQLSRSDSKGALWWVNKLKEMLIVFWTEHIIRWSEESKASCWKKNKKHYFRKITTENSLTWKWEPEVSWSALPLHCLYPGSWRSSGPGTNHTSTHRHNHTCLNVHELYCGFRRWC